MGRWKECTISDIGTVVGGATPSTKSQENYNGGTIAWITPKDLSSFHGRYISHGERNITKAGLNSCSAQLLPAQTVLFSSRAPIGYVAIAENEVCTNQGFKSVVPNKDTNPLFLYYLLKYNKDKIESMGSGTTFKEVSGTTMKGVQVYVPVETKEQAVIGGILGSLDDKIEENDQINQNLMEQMLTLYQNLIANSLIVSQKELHTLCNFQEGYVNPSQTHAEYFDGDIKWLRAVDINESFIIQTSRTLTEIGYESAGKSAQLFEPKTIVISKSGTVGRLGILADYMCGNRAVIDIDPIDKENLPLIYAYLKIHQPEFPEMAVGSVQKNLYISLLEPLIVPIPDEIYLNQFNKTGNVILDTIYNNCIESNNLTILRDTLLPKLMSGELDVSTLNI